MINEQIRDKEVRLIGENGEQLGIMSAKDALKLAKEVQADIVLATDPDADRLGIYAYDTKSGEYVPFTGNMSGMLIAEYILRERTATGTMPENPALVSTIVTTNMADEGENLFYQFGTAENRREIEKRMEKLVLSIELGAWDKAELLSETLKTLMEGSGSDLKRLLLRLGMAIRKENYDKSMEVYKQMNQVLFDKFEEM